MIPNAKNRDVQSQGVTASSSFGISMKDATHIMTILRDTLYSDKVLAVLREYSANAWDANREVGKMGTPIKVIIPTAMEPTLIIQDFGPGLSQEDVLNVYTQYGASTKRDSDLAVGMLGIGSKSGFAYSDSFTVVSQHDGKKKMYVAVLDESNAGTIQLLHEEDCGEETGVAIHIAVRPEDIREFVKKARNLFQHFIPRPEINIDLPPAPTEKTMLKNGAIYEDGDGWIAVMGCVPYRINIDQLRGMDPAEGVGEYLFKMAGILYFDIGEVEINASREELKYSDKTKKILVTQFNLLVDEFVQHTMDAVENDSISSWDKRLRAQIFNRLGLPVPEAWKDLVRSYLSFPLPKDGKFFLYSVKGNPVQRITVADQFRILLVDDKRNIKGFNTNYYDILAKPTSEDLTVDELQKAVEEACRGAGMDGVTIRKLSEVPWSAVINGKPVNRKKDKKHKVKTFVVKTDSYHSHPWSRGWDIASRVPADDDVFVVLSKFQPTDARYKFYEMLRQDRKLAENFGASFPPIYGYKTTAKKPVTEADCKGTEYRKWRREFHKSLVTAKVAPLVEHMGWLAASDRSGYYHLRRNGYYHLRRDGNYELELLKDLIKDLGKDHPITQIHIKIAVAKKRLRRLGQDRYDSLRNLCHLLSPTDEYGDEGPTPQQQQHFHEVLGKYPLLGEYHDDDFSRLAGSGAEHWRLYVKLIDKYEQEKTDESTILHNHE